MGRRSHDVEIERLSRSRAPPCPWRGVNLGGWLLLEPGPSAALFARHSPTAADDSPKCEWDFMQILHQKDALSELVHHRETYITRDDFARIRSCGLNAVRLPFGYWAVLPPSGGEPYVGPMLEYIDRAIGWAEELGLQVLLDLHGCPGGESGDAPCGRRQRPAERWHWSDWCISESLRTLKVLATRYHACKAVTGIAVCNEPSPSMPLTKLCQYYDMAVEIVRGAGMHERQVAIVLPVFKRPLKEFTKTWKALTGDRHENVCFDLHYYHCFGPQFDGMTLSQQLRVVEKHALELRSFPTVIGEWSLALGRVARSSDLQDDEVRALFGSTQLGVYKEASHGWFFWTWKDGHGAEWDFQESYREGSLASRPCELPLWSGIGKDPLDDMLDSSPPERVSMGDTIFLRTYHGKYIDVDGSTVKARWADKGEWQQITLCPPPSKSSGVREDSAAIADGDTILLRAHNGNFITVVGDQVLACSDASHPPQCFEFTVCIIDDMALRFRGIICIRSKDASRMIDVDVDSDQVQARWDHMGDWQRLVVEKHVVDAPSLPATPRKEACCVRVATPQPKRRKISPIPTKAHPLDLTPSPPRKRCAALSGMCQEVTGAC